MRNNHLDKWVPFRKAGNREGKPSLLFWKLSVSSPGDQHEHFFSSWENLRGTAVIHVSILWVQKQTGEETSLSWGNWISLCIFSYFFELMCASLFISIKLINNSRPWNGGVYDINDVGWDKKNQTQHRKHFISKPDSLKLNKIRLCTYFGRRL